MFLKCRLAVCGCSIIMAQLWLCTSSETRERILWLCDKQRTGRI